MFEEEFYRCMEENRCGSNPEYHCTSMELLTSFDNGNCSIFVSNSQNGNYPRRVQVGFSEDGEKLVVHALNRGWGPAEGPFASEFKEFELEDFEGLFGYIQDFIRWAPFQEE